LTYLWTATSNTGDVTVGYNPDKFVEAPAVTITKDFSVVPIGNPGFEIPVLADDDWDQIPFDSWEVWGGNDDSTGTWNITTDVFTDEAYEGYNVACVEADNRYGDPNGGLAQVLDVDLAADTTYTLTVQVGNPKLGDYAGPNIFPGYRVQLLAGGVILAEDPDSLAVPEDTWVTATLVYNSGAAPAQFGEALEIRLGTMANPSGGTGMDLYVLYDDVRLTVDPPRPPSSAVATVTLTLDVNDETNPTPVTDSMTIDVYDTACMAARFGLGGAAENPSDFNGDCDTTLADFAEMAEKWLNETGLDDPFEILP
jgi:hypothetical protein